MIAMIVRHTDPDPRAAHVHQVRDHSHRIARAVMVNGSRPHAADSESETGKPVGRPFAP